MPLIGTICCQTGKPQTFDKCMAECREGKCQHPLPLLAAMHKDSTKRAGIGISSSVLGGCPRQYILGQRNDYHEDPEQYYARWMGSFGHYAVEMGGPYDGVVQEVRFFRHIEVDSVTFEISGQPDWYDETHHRLEDSKFVGWKPKSLKQDHESQINVYTWLLEGNGHRVDSAAVNYFHPGQKPDYRRHTTFNVPFWTTEGQESYIRRRLRPHAGYAKDGNLGLVKADDDYQWGNSCPFQQPCNPGRCCRSNDVAVP